MRNKRIKYRIKQWLKRHHLMHTEWGDWVAAPNTQPFGRGSHSHTTPTADWSRPGRAARRRIYSKPEDRAQFAAVLNLHSQPPHPATTRQQGVHLLREPPNGGGNRQRPPQPHETNAPDTAAHPSTQASSSGDTTQQEALDQPQQQRGPPPHSRSKPTHPRRATVLLHQAVAAASPEPGRARPQHTTTRSPTAATATNLERSGRSSKAQAAPASSTKATHSSGTRGRPHKPPKQVRGDQPPSHHRATKQGPSRHLQATKGTATNSKESSSSTGKGRGRTKEHKQDPAGNTHHQRASQSWRDTYAHPTQPSSSSARPTTRNPTAARAAPDLGQSSWTSRRRGTPTTPALA